VGHPKWSFIKDIWGASKDNFVLVGFLGIQSGLLAHTKLGSIHRVPSSKYLQI